MNENKKTAEEILKTGPYDRVKAKGQGMYYTEWSCIRAMEAYAAQFQTPTPVSEKLYTEAEVIGMLRLIKFHDRHFSNETWHPDESDIKDMGEEIYKEAMSEYEKSQSYVLFDGLRVQFESCDCGDGYGCSHGSWPYKIMHDFPDVDMCWEDEGFYIESKTGLIRFDKTDDITMYHFAQACELLGLKLIFREQSILSINPQDILKEGK